MLLVWICRIGVKQLYVLPIFAIDVQPMQSHLIALHMSCGIAKSPISSIFEYLDAKPMSTFLIRSDQSLMLNRCHAYSLATQTSRKLIASSILHHTVFTSLAMQFSMNHLSNLTHPIIASSGRICCSISLTILTHIAKLLFNAMIAPMRLLLTTMMILMILMILHLLLMSAMSAILMRRTAIHLVES